ncbi:MAG: response regulator transcription factor [Acidobacteriota bacterium]
MSGGWTGQSEQAPTVFVVDDDRAMRDSLAFLLESVGLVVRCYASGQEFLDGYEGHEAGCLVLDVRMPAMSGLELQEKLNRRGLEIPVILMTAYADVPMAVRAMHQGAIDFIEKPFNEQALLERVQRALAEDANRRRGRGDARVLENRIERLTPREREVMQKVAEGLSNKQIASALNLSPKTVEQHRAKVMSKMEADSLAALVRMAVEAGVV